jgi:hypothetical protein
MVRDAGGVWHKNADRSDVVVGVKRITRAGYIADTDEAANCSIAQMWVTVNGVVIPGVLMRVEWGPEGENGGANEVTIKVACSSFKTVDAYGPEAPPEYQPQNMPILEGAK